MAPRKGTGAYAEEELTAEEKAAIEEHDRSDELPPAEDGEEVGDQPAAEEPAAAAEAPKPAEEPKPVAEAAPAEVKPPEATPEEREAADLASFMEKHKGKSPEEILQLAFQQSKRANKESAANRVATTALQTLGQRAKSALERRDQLRSGAPQRKDGFKEKLAKDPDEATAELHSTIVDRELAEAEEEADRALFEEAIGFAQTYVPDFQARWPKMTALAQEVGFSQDEMNNVRDGRDLVVLSLAQVAADLMKGGIIDARGSLIAVPKPTTEPTDPRLNAPDPIRTAGSGGARASDASPSTESQLLDMLNMSDADFDKLDPAQLETILRAAG